MGAGGVLTESSSHGGPGDLPSSPQQMLFTLGLLLLVACSQPPGVCDQSAHSCVSGNSGQRRDAKCGLTPRGRLGRPLPPCSSHTESYTPLLQLLGSWYLKRQARREPTPKDRSPGCPPSCWDQPSGRARFTQASRALQCRLRPGPLGGGPSLQSSPGGPQSSAPGRARGLSFPRRSRAGFPSRLWVSG